MDNKSEMAITQTHISTLQNIIARLSNYSMSCKTWAVTICYVLFFLGRLILLIFIQYF